MQLTKVVDVDDARVEALTPEAFRLVLEARGWERFFDGESLAALGAMADAHHNGATFDAFTEVERVQALLSAVEAAERGEWRGSRIARGYKREDAPSAGLRHDGWVAVADFERQVMGEWLWEGRNPDPDRAAREARAQLSRLVRIICGVEGE